MLVVSLFQMFQQQVSVNVASLGFIFSSLSGVIALKEFIKVAKKKSSKREEVHGITLAWTHCLMLLEH